VICCRSYLCSREGGPHTSPTPEALRPLSHNANPREGAQDIANDNRGSSQFCLSALPNLPIAEALGSAQLPIANCRPEVASRGLRKKAEGGQPAASGAWVVVEWVVGVGGWPSKAVRGHCFPFPFPLRLASGCWLGAEWKGARGCFNKANNLCITPTSLGDMTRTKLN
jgi:hypothetical protein